MMRVELQDLLLKLWRDLNLTILFVTMTSTRRLSRATRDRPQRFARHRRRCVDVPLPIRATSRDAQSTDLPRAPGTPLSAHVEQVMAGRVVAS